VVQGAKKFDADQFGERYSLVNADGEQDLTVFGCTVKAQLGKLEKIDQYVDL